MHHDNFSLSILQNHDYQLDIYRALMMIYVPCIIHVIYWLGKGHPYINSLLLFEMPVIFYISGATMYITGKKRDLKDTVINRTKRLLLPYIFFIFGCFVFIIAWALISRTDVEYKSISIIKILTAQDGSMPVLYMWHLWFVVPYLIVSCSFPIQQRWADKINRWVYMLVLLALCLIGPILTYLHPVYLKPIREALFYNFFFIAGYLFYKKLTFKSLITLTIVSGVIVGSNIWHEWNTTGGFSMQAHKFPPDFLFIAFGIFAISVLGLLFSNFTIPNNRIFNHWNKYGYSIYLWQNFSFIIYGLIYKYSGLQILSNHPLADFLVASLGIFIISSLTSLAIVPLEKVFIGLLSNHK
ncbi:MAG: acyltransferase [Muribaculaceae bacterium]|nr:acyltransferase [Muribaculaceae bacterium]